MKLLILAVSLLIGGCFGENKSNSNNEYDGRGKYCECGADFVYTTQDKSDYFYDILVRHGGRYVKTQYEGYTEKAYTQEQIRILGKGGRKHWVKYDEIFGEVVTVGEKIQ